MSKSRIRTLASAVAVAAASASFSTRQGQAEGTQQYALQVLPPGPVSAPGDGRPALLHDNAALATAFNAKGRKAVLDVGHLTEFSDSATAAGWVVELFVAEDGGLWAWVEMTAEGERLVGERLFGFTSPTLYVRPGVGADGGEQWLVTGFKSLALTNNPALDTMSANFSATGADASAEDDPDAETAASGQEAVQAAAEEAAAPAEEPATSSEPGQQSEPSAPAAATQAAAADLATLSAQHAQAATQVASLSAQVATLTAERDAALLQVASLQAALAQHQSAEVDRVIAEFTARGHCTPAEREALREQAAALGLDKLRAALSLRTPHPAFSALQVPTATTDDGTAAYTEEEQYLLHIAGGSDRLVQAYRAARKN